MPADATAGVYLKDRRVGTLAFENQFTRFVYEDLSADHPVLGQTFEDDPDRPRSARVDVPEWFANLLPEPDSQLRKVIAAQLDIKPPRSFPILVHLGEDLPGAVRVVLENQETVDHDLDITPDEFAPGRLHFSLAGLQLKFSMYRTERGLTLPMKGEAGDWIVKLPDPRFRNLPENEYTMLTWASRAGIAVPEHDLGADRRSV